MSLSKRARSASDVFDVAELAELLTPYARLKDCDWDWEFAEYGKIEEARAQTEADWGATDPF